MDIYKVYSNVEGYQGELTSLIDLVHYIAATPPNENLTITDIFDNLILTTYGFFLNNVPDKQLVTKIQPQLIELQMGNSPIKEISLIK